MPETVSSLDIRKGPYFADVGDFASAGSLFLNLRDSVDKKIVEATAGSFNYERLFTMGSAKFGGGSLLYAAEANTYDGPWTAPDGMHKFSGLLRYSQGTATDGFSASAMAYRTSGTRPNRFVARDHVRTDRPLRRDRPGRRRQYQPLLPVGADGAIGRRTDHGKPMPIWSNTTSTCTTISPGFLPIRSTAISFVSTTIASMAAPEHRAPIEGTLFGLRRKPCTVSSRATTTSICPEQHFPAAVSVATFSTTMSAKGMAAFMPRTRCIGPTGCARRSAGAAIISRRR